MLPDTRPAELLNSPKGLHLLQIVTAGVTGVYAETMLQVPGPDEIVHFIQVGAQLLIALVTCWATIRKALQKPLPTVQQVAEGEPENNARG